MPDLPTLTLSTDHFNRVVAAFPGATSVEKAAAYKDWLRNRLIERVQMVEARRIDEDANAQKIAQLATLAAALPPMAPEPGIPNL